MTLATKTKIVARVQGHPSRTEMQERLLSAIEPMPTEVSLHSSEPPNPWEGYQLALRSGLATDATHILVLQDDVEVCRNLTPAVEKIVAAKPDDCVSLYLSYLPRPLTIDALQMLKMGKRYSRARSASFWPVLAVIWPREHAEHFLDWTAANRRHLPGAPNLVASDDGVFGEWGRRNQVTLWITCPSLVEHPDRVESLIGRRALWGRDKGRCAFHWIGPDADPLELDWS